MQPTSCGWKTLRAVSSRAKEADFVLLEENPLKVDPMKIKDIRILGTVFEGKPYPLVLSDDGPAEGMLKPVPAGDASR